MTIVRIHRSCNHLPSRCYCANVAGGGAKHLPLLAWLAAHWKDTIEICAHEGQSPPFTTHSKERSSTNCGEDCSVASWVEPIKTFIKRYWFVLPEWDGSSSN
ncbi:uncharacterized protein LACBIDRAFT_303758 [Laccaria bicolor S238N-H82]|uniref:Predicted protein n=1 Tax=Laccaria bicolor (strain S238N-H82 / ATCC MYA-4686) TaxID=486041 RepID=B0DK90_LACBS|nr:uncharacterized protein LACBIDRAFT_303758 [Laccaria bicolor S238N-H82]EDR04900.1 predicted protein [Laccaria bicolor S238N-H82]|eukprot:XP_001884290.1 predicted protein [Laccaria bicolor S238N-H82]